MKRYLSPVLIGLAGALALLLAACDVPAPPPELGTPTPLGQGRVTVTPAQPTPTTAPDGGGQIWFVRGGTLWSAGPNGENPIQRSTQPVSAPPVLAPEGHRVAFSNNQQVVVYDADAGTARVVATGTIALNQRLGWSPDGQRLAYFTLSGQATGDEQIWSVGVNAAAPPTPMMTITVPGYRGGATFERVAGWAPDGRRFLASGIYGPIQVIPLSSSAGDPFTVNGGEPYWSADGRYILYTQAMNGALAIFDVVGDATPFVNEKREVGTRLGEYAQGPGPRFSPDGTQVLYRSRMADGTPAVAVRDLYGVEGLYLPGNNASWSPDGNWIVYETGVLKQTDLGLAWQATGLAKVHLDGSNMAQILQDASLPTWGR
jgi:Tol biopolymer transport system component